MIVCDVVCEDKKNVTYKDGESIFIIDIKTFNAVFDNSGCVARERVAEQSFGRIGHNKNYAIDRAIEALESLKDKE